MKILSNKIITQWQNIQQQLLEDSADSVEIHYNYDYSGPTANYNELYKRSTDARKPKTVAGGSFDEPDAVTVSGRFHADLYSIALSRSDEIQNLPIGIFEPGDALFTCLLENAQKDTANLSGGFYFDNVKYVYSNKTQKRYKVKKLATRGLGSLYVLDVFLGETNVK